MALQPKLPELPPASSVTVEDAEVSATQIVPAPRAKASNPKVVSKDANGNKVEEH